MGVYLKKYHIFRAIIALREVKKKNRQRLVKQSEQKYAGLEAERTVK